MSRPPGASEVATGAFLSSEMFGAQDHDMDVIQSRQHVAARYGVSQEQVRHIEREGLDNGWPPL